MGRRGPREQPPARREQGADRAAGRAAPSPWTQLAAGVVSFTLAAVLGCLGSLVLFGLTVLAAALLLS